MWDWPTASPIRCTSTSRGNAALIAWSRAPALPPVAVPDVPVVPVNGDPAGLRARLRRLLYDVEYPTTTTQSQPAMLFGTAAAMGAAVTV